MKLQNNFTTPEQSKRLLELGLPADSADCSYYGNYSKIGILEQGFQAVRPCWSVGRLIEIWGHLTGNDYLIVSDDILDGSMVQTLCDDLQTLTTKGYDFSKLEE